MVILRRLALPFCFTNSVISSGGFRWTVIPGTGSPLEIPWKYCSTARVKLIGLREKIRALTTEIDHKKKQAGPNSASQIEPAHWMRADFRGLTQPCVGVLTSFQSRYSHNSQLLRIEFRICQFPMPLFACISPSFRAILAGFSRDKSGLMRNRK